MQNPLRQLGELNKMRKQARIIQKALAQEEVVVEKEGVRIVMTADQKIKEMKIDGESAPRIKKALEKALAESQKIAAKKMMGMKGGLGGLLGQS